MKKEKDDFPQPRYYEIEAFRRSVNRKLWLVMGFLGTTTLASLFLAFVAFARPLPVVAFDKRGRAILFEDTVSPRYTLSDVRIEYFTREFVRRWVGIDSVNVDEDTQGALNVMTPEFRKVVMADRREMSRRAGYKGKNVRSLFSDWRIRIGKYDPADKEGKVYVLASGKMTFVPRFGEVTGTDGPSEVTRHFLTQLVLRRVPVTRVSVDGLQVGYSHTRFFTDRDQLEAYMLERATTR